MRKQNKTNTYLQHEQLDLLLLWFYCVFVCHFLLDLHQIKIQIIYLQMKKKTRLKSTHKLYVSTEPSLTFCLRNRKQRPFIKAYNNATVKVHGVTPSFSISWYTFKMYCVTSHTKCRFWKEFHASYSHFLLKFCIFSDQYPKSRAPTKFKSYCHARAWFARKHPFSSVR